jgi:predicted Fe-S protein YdhL (DUF1289 family)
MSPISTPCRNICVVDPRSGLCTGCGRSLDEIASWGRLGEPERRAIMVELPRRMARASAPMRPALQRR